MSWQTCWKKWWLLALFEKCGVADLVENRLVTCAVVAVEENRFLWWRRVVTLALVLVLLTVRFPAGAEVDLCLDCCLRTKAFALKVLWVRRGRRPGRRFSFRVVLILCFLLVLIGILLVLVLFPNMFVIFGLWFTRLGTRLGT